MGIFSFLFRRREYEYETQKHRKEKMEREIEEAHNKRKSNLYEKFGKWIIEEVGINPLMFGMMDGEIDHKTSRIIEKSDFDIKKNPNSRVFFEKLKVLNLNERETNENKKG